MMGSTHRWFGALTGATVATMEGAGTAQVVMAALAASALAHGEFSPDMDQTPGWRRLFRVIPVPGLGQHRYGLSHWWVIPCMMWLAVLLFVPPEGHWIGLAFVAGWSSHLLGDVIFGKLCLGPNGRGPKFGLGLKTDGFIESGKVHMGGREVTVIPFGPTKVAIILALVGVVWLSPDLRGLGVPDLRQALNDGIDWVMEHDTPA